VIQKCALSFSLFINVIAYLLYYRANNKNTTSNSDSTSGGDNTTDNSNNNGLKYDYYIESPAYSTSETKHLLEQRRNSMITLPHGSNANTNTNTTTYYDSSNYSINEDNTDKGAVSGNSSRLVTILKYFTTYTIFLIYLLFLITITVLSLLSVFLLGKQHHHTMVWAQAMGIVSSVFTIMQWTPQIITTACVTRGAGNLSVVMVTILLPGSWLNVVFMVLAEQVWSTWLPPLLCGIQQLLLLVILIYFEKIHKRITRNNDNSNEQVAN